MADFDRPTRSLANVTTGQNLADAPIPLTASSPAPLDARAPDVVLLTVKGGATAACARELAAQVPAGTPVVSFQNGVENVARLRAAAPNLVALAGMIPYNVVQVEPGYVRRTTQGVAMAERAHVTERLAWYFSRAKLPLQLRDDMPAVQWGKLLLNLNNPINALSGLPLRAQLLDSGYRRLLAALQIEALSVLARAGITPAKVAPLAPSWIPWMLRLPTYVFQVLAAGMLRIAADARSSMQEDRRAGRVTEIDDLCGAVVRLAETHGTAAPLNAALCALMQAVAPAETYSAEQLRQRLRVAVGTHSINGSELP